jgi:hypothetical protein
MLKKTNISETYFTCFQCSAYFSLSGEALLFCI